MVYSLDEKKTSIKNHTMQALKEPGEKALVSILLYVNLSFNRRKKQIF